MTSLAGAINDKILAVNSPNINSRQKNLSIKNGDKEVHSRLSGVKEPGL